ncbi:UNVERIFIED_CONTAM: hypothetical protein GTU68_058862 [Idotea baltica]|nr:hypothetical protein [Idotea baltica]
MKEVRTRFAPSPTGMQHLGGFRTAMFAWLLARKNNGKFILRIEDTDQDRKVPGATKYIIDSLNWLGIDWDQSPDIGGDSGPYVQSLRLEKYQEVAHKLIDLGFAYRCDCTSEMLKKEREEQMARRETPGYSGYCRTRNVSKDTKHVVRLKMPYDLSLSMEDAVRGRISWENPPLRDPVILKSDGFPTYHLASVVDDHEMKISHVMRGEEWIPTTPIHLFLYEALGWEKPVFCHLSHILGSDGKKLSKRHGANSLDEYKKQGYLPEALLNFILLIGWSPGEGDEQEIFTKDELFKKFSLEHLSNTSGVFDINKLEWINGIYIRNLSSQDFKKVALPFMEDSKLKFDDSRWDLISKSVQDRLKNLTEVKDMVSFLFQENIDRDYPDMLKKGVDQNMAISILKSSYQKLSDVSDFTKENIEIALKQMVSDLGVKMGQGLTTVRIAVTAKKITPPLFDSIYALNKEATLLRIQESIKELEAPDFTR